MSCDLTQKKNPGFPDPEGSNGHTLTHPQDLGSGHRPRGSGPHATPSSSPQAGSEGPGRPPESELAAPGERRAELTRTDSFQCPTTGETQGLTRTENQFLGNGVRTTQISTQLTLH